MRNTNAINLAADILAPLAVIVVTIALFYLFMPLEPGTLFWTNMVYSVFLEVILFAYIIWLPKRGDSVALKWMCGIYSIIYICISLLWMLLFGLILTNWASIKVYFAVIAVLTVLWVLVAALSLKADNANEIATENLNENRMRVEDVRNNADMLLQQFNLMASANPGLSLAAPSVTSLCRGLNTLSPTAMSQPTVAKRIIQLTNGLEEILNGSSSTDLAIDLKNYADRSLITLNSIKKSILK